jgi:hypothetical protein
MTNLDWARAQLRAVGGALTTVHYWLKGVQASLPPGQVGSFLEDFEADLDIATHMGAVIGGATSTWNCPEPSATGWRQVHPVGSL